MQFVGRFSAKLLDLPALPTLANAVVKLPKPVRENGTMARPFGQGPPRLRLPKIRVTSP